MTAFLAIRAFLKGVPWQVYAAAALLAAFWFYGNHQYKAGRAVEIARFEAAAEKAQQEAVIAAASADKKEQARAAEFEAVQGALTQEIEDAKADDRNSLDAIFSILPATD